MVSHQTCKRRRRNVKVTRKLPKNKSLVVANSVKHSTIRENYDRSLTPEQNLRNMGLDPNPNHFQGRHVKDPSVKVDPKYVGFVGMTSISDAKSYSEANPNRRFMSEFDQIYAKNNITKHNNDYKAMERDIAINNRQLSENQMKKLCEKFLALDEKQRLVSL